MTKNKFNWNEVVIVPDIPWEESAGNQILHFRPNNKDYTKDPAAVKFVNTHLKDAAILQSDAEVLQFGSTNVQVPGLYIEVGVCTGKTINFIAALNPHQIIYGFDSFAGLPSDWNRGDFTIEAKTFAFKDQTSLPPVLHNVQLIQGLFQDSLPKFKQQILQNQPIAFLHIDCDIYSSTAEVFTIFAENLQPGTVIVFDELYNYPLYAEHEWKALGEFLQKNNLTAEYLAYNPLHEQVALRLAKLS